MSGLTQRLPISVRTTLWYGLSLVVLLGLFSGFLYGSLHVALHRDFDQHLLHERREIGPFIQLTATGPTLRPEALTRSVGYRSVGAGGTFIRVFDRAGRLRAETPNLRQIGPWQPQIPGVPEAASVSFDWTGMPLRLLYEPLIDDQGRLQGWVEVAGFEWSRHRELHRLAVLIALGMTVSLVLALGGGYLLSRRALRPIAKLTAAARTVGERRDLSVRLPVSGGVRDELSDLAETFNGMIARLEAAFNRERRFTADAAHELMTPLAILQNEVEVTLRRPRSAEAYAASMAEVQADLNRATRLVARLLELARVEAGQDRVQRTGRVDLAAVVQERVAALHPVATAHGVRLTLDPLPALSVRGDEVQLGEAVTNLVENGLKYTQAGGTVRVRGRAEHERVVLEVADTGVGFDPQEAERLFERFYRSDRPEVQARSGTGLGLAIGRGIAEAHGGTLTARSPGPGFGSTFSLDLPRAL